ncbi:hypothetical protein FQA39_LY18558 [Lamprigera yunnana]|nr:hypothetical protein FQA39_LY18558 [Lamprigera yunnana]
MSEAATLGSHTLSRPGEKKKKKNDEYRATTPAMAIEAKPVAAFFHPAWSRLGELEPSARLREEDSAKCVRYQLPIVGIRRRRHGGSVSGSTETCAGEYRRWVCCPSHLVLLSWVSIGPGSGRGVCPTNAAQYNAPISAAAAEGEGHGGLGRESPPRGGGEPRPAGYREADSAEYAQGQHIPMPRARRACATQFDRDRRWRRSADDLADEQAGHDPERQFVREQLADDRTVDRDAGGEEAKIGTHVRPRPAGSDAQASRRSCLARAAPTVAAKPRRACRRRPCATVSTNEDALAQHSAPHRPVMRGEQQREAALRRASCDEEPPQAAAWVEHVEADRVARRGSAAPSECISERGDFARIPLSQAELAQLAGRVGAQSAAR